MRNHIAKQIYTTILAAKSIVLIPHKNPDGDALGSSTAFAEWLSTLQKSFSLFCKTNASYKFSYLPHFEKISSDKSIWENPIDVVVVFDSGDIVYAGVQEEISKLKDNTVIINIDHHATNIFFGNFNFVDATASSTSEMIHRFFSINNISINKSMSTSLMTGFITDTDNFTNAATSGPAISAVGNLLKKGNQLVPIQDRVYKNISMPGLKVWGKMLERLEYNKELAVVYSYILEQDIVESGVEEKEREGFFTLMNNYMNNIEEGKMKFLLKETGSNLWRGSFRTTRDDVDVSKYAKIIDNNGGGHKKAAGFQVSGTLEKSLQNIFDAIKSTNPNP